MRADSPLGFGGGSRAGCGIRSVLNPAERIAGARKSQSAGARGALPVRSREFTSPGCKWPFLPAAGVRCLGRGLPVLWQVAKRDSEVRRGLHSPGSPFLFPAPECEIPPKSTKASGFSQTRPPRLAPASPASRLPPGASKHPAPGKDCRGGGGGSRRRHGEVPEGRPGRCRSCVTLPLFGGPFSVH